MTASSVGSSEQPPDPTEPRPAVPPPARRPRVRAGTGLGLGAATIYLSLIVLIPLAMVVWRSTVDGPAAFWRAVRTPDAWSALELTVVASLVVALINLVMGTVIAWVLVRDSFPGKRIVDALIDLPFALPTIVAGLVLLALYGPQSPLGVNLAYTRAGVVVALLFVTLPFVVRTVQPVLLELDRDMEEAAASLGAGPWYTFRRIILPNLVPAMVAGTALAFTRSIAEFGSTVLISGNLPFKTQVAAVHIFGQIESDNATGAAAASTVLLGTALVVLVGLDLVQRWGARRG
jgi:sulfate/thiosulfate transport system permease protein